LKKYHGDFEIMNQVRALVIKNDNQKFRDLEGVVRVARALGQQVLKTHEHVRVTQIWHDSEYDYAVVIERPEQERTNRLDVRRGKEGV